MHKNCHSVWPVPLHIHSPCMALTKIYCLWNLRDNKSLVKQRENKDKCVQEPRPKGFVFTRRRTTTTTRSSLRASVRNATRLKKKTINGQTRLKERSLVTHWPYTAVLQRSSIRSNKFIQWSDIVLPVLGSRFATFKKWCHIEMLYTVHKVFLTTARRAH